MNWFVSIIRCNGFVGKSNDNVKIRVESMQSAIQCGVINQ